MTKSNRHKKFRKQEKAKTQLTGVKKLTKAKNVVEPTLRVKKILIREQLKSGSAGDYSSSNLRGLSSQSSVVGSIDDESTDTGYTRRKQSIAELLSSANHHNTNIRKEAVLGLQEIATSQINTVIRNLDKVLAKIANLTSDQEALVRKENLKLAEMIIPKVSESQLRPFWSMLIAHLKCTMTHLIASVRYGALPFISLLVDHHAILVSESGSILLPSILGLISTSAKDASSSSSSTVSSSSTATKTRLKVEITGKQNDLNARLKVLRVLNKCLLLSSSKSDLTMEYTRKASIETSFNQFPYLSVKYPFGYCWGQAQEDEIRRKYLLDVYSGSIRSYTDRFYSTITADPFVSPFTTETSEKSSNFWTEFTQSCIPILIESWVETGPLAQDSGGHHGEKERKGSKGFKKQYAQIGSDMEGNSAAYRRNGLHILTGSAVESLLCITTLFSDLIQRNRKTSSGNSDLHEQSLKTMRKLYGQNLKKYFYSLMPYVSVQESSKRDVITANLNLFLVAGELKMFDNEIKRKLFAFIEGQMESTSIDKEHCEYVLGILKYLESEKEKGRELCTNFLLFATKSGHCDIISTFLSSLICPRNMKQAMNNSLREFILHLRWSEIVTQLLLEWSKQTNYSEEGTQTLMELLTFAALRRLTDVKLILCQNVTKLEERISLSNSKAVWDAVYRVFFYAEAEALFKTHLASASPPSLTLVAASTTVLDN